MAVNPLASQYAFIQLIVPGMQVSKNPANLDMLKGITPSFMLCGDLNSDLRHGIPGEPIMEIINSTEHEAAPSGSIPGKCCS